MYQRINRVTYWLLVFIVCGLSGASFSLTHAQQRDVEIRLHSLQIHDDCDNISEGDWFVDLRTAQSGALQDEVVAVFPNLVDAADVDTGETVSINRSVTLPRVPVSNDIEVVVNAVDCDAGPASLSGYFLIPFFPFIPEGFANFESDAIVARQTSFDCDGEEEVLEISSDHDAVGSVVLRLTPSQWTTNRILTARPLSSTQCFDGRLDLPGIGIISEPGGSKAYTASIEIIPGELIVDGSLIGPVLDLLATGLGCC
ncbi:MAG: hypothetical protein MRJ96_14445 [Nitrospirales bacterium]|nr:hypothetical protein [Nitrospira sp.]MDR4502640.1 hypothetical protein [Nitrospirales bacterium]